MLYYAGTIVKPEIPIVEPTGKEAAHALVPLVESGVRIAARLYMAQVNMIFGAFNLHDEFSAQHQLNYLSDVVRVLFYTGTRYAADADVRSAPPERTAEAVAGCRTPHLHLEPGPVFSCGGSRCHGIGLRWECGWGTGGWAANGCLAMAGVFVAAPAARETGGLSMSDVCMMVDGSCLGIPARKRQSFRPAPDWRALSIRCSLLNTQSRCSVDPCQTPLRDVASIASPIG